MQHIEQTASPIQNTSFSGEPGDTLRLSANQAVNRAVLLKKIALTCFIFIASLLLLEAVARVWVVLSKPPQSHFVNFDRKLQIAQSYTTKDKAYSNLLVFAGSSHTANEIYAEQLQMLLRHKGIPINVLNLGVSSNFPDMNIYLLKQLIKSGNKPRLLVVDVAPAWMFNQSFYNSETSSISKFKKSYIGRCLTQPLYSNSKSVECFLARYSYLIRFREYFGQQIRDIPQMVFDAKHLSRFDNVVMPAIETSSQGWSPHYTVFDNEKDFVQAYTDPRYIKGAVTPLYEKFQWNSKPFQELQQFCKQEDIPLVAVWFPEHPLQERYYRTYHLSVASLRTGIQRLSRQPNNYFIDLQDMPFQLSEFQDPHHLNTLGTIVFNQRLATIFSKEPYVSILKRQATEVNP